MRPPTPCVFRGLNHKPSHDVDREAHLETGEGKEPETYRSIAVIALLIGFFSSFLLSHYFRFRERMYSTKNSRVGFTQIPHLGCYCICFQQIDQ
jgi:hypothetical protein